MNTLTKLANMSIEVLQERVPDYKELEEEFVVTHTEQLLLELQDLRKMYNEGPNAAYAAKRIKEIYIEEVHPFI